MQPHYALDGWLKAVRADGLVPARTRVAGPWRLTVPSRDAVALRFVAEGRAFVRQPGVEKHGIAGSFTGPVSAWRCT